MYADALELALRHREEAARQQGLDDPRGVAALELLAVAAGTFALAELDDAIDHED